MKKLLVLVTLVLFSFPLAQATILTNTNQSAQYVRMLSRNASTDIDAVYYNPAGLTKLSDGFHLSLSNQSLFQERTVVNNFPLLNNDTFIGKVNAPIFPNLYAVYKKGPFALAFGFGPNAGGGSADFADGLPSFDLMVSSTSYIYGSLLQALTGIPYMGYDADISFKGSSVFYGFQANAAYAVNDIISLAAGARYISAVNTYEGSLSNHKLLPYNFQLIPDSGVDAKQTGTGITPIFGLFLQPVENLNFGIRYEMKTKLELTNDTALDDFDLFPDGETTRSDMPAILGLGVQYGFLPGLRASVSFNTYFDKDIDWDDDPDNDSLIDSNSYDIAFGLEFDLSETFLLSAGFMMTNIGVNEDFQSDLNHELSSNAIGFGGRLKFSPRVALNFGALFVTYKNFENDFVLYKETYKRSSWGATVSLDIHLGR